MNDNKLRFLYRLIFEQDECIEFPIEIDQANCTLVSAMPGNPPPWTQLDYHQCSNCPLKPEHSPHCPVAINLIPILSLCSDMTSHTNVGLEVIGPERTVSGNTTMQRALSSILGLIMATSPCPHTGFLKPMARFHLPLASEHETIYRVASMYLLAQYFRFKEGLNFNLEFSSLKSMYENLQIVNKCMAQRLRAGVTDDAAINAIVLLNLLSQAVNWSIDDDLEEIRDLFRSYGVLDGPTH